MKRFFFFFFFFKKRVLFHVGFFWKQSERSGRSTCCVASEGAAKGPKQLSLVLRRSQWNAVNFSAMGHLFGLLDLDDGT